MRDLNPSSTWGMGVVGDAAPVARGDGDGEGQSTQLRRGPWLVLAAASATDPAPLARVELSCAKKLAGPASSDRPMPAASAEASLR
jgi:hypothetical protein